MATKKKLPGLKLAVFDTETTGLPLHRRSPLKKQPRVIEFAAAIYDSSTHKLIDEYVTLINPGITITDEITKITGITPEQLSAYGVPVYSEVEKKIADFLGQADVTIAHNHPFDQLMIELEMMRLGKPGEFPWPAGKVCTVEYFKPLWGRRPKLTEVYERIMGEPLNQTHRALDDVNALAQVCLKEEVWK